ncbi:hypothetical protein [Streptomyces sp. NPDC020141]|uniref:hypothetical protein n=1 Tax=Streptomyces sp. NPDC020141 TaxID=3365065 RepID=UPI0037B0DDB4
MSAEAQIATDPETDDIEETEGTERPRLFLVPVPGPLAARLADLRPYLPTRSQLAVPFRGVGAGAGVLVGRGWTWISEDGWIWEGWTKVGGLAVGAYFGLPVVWNVAVGIAGPYAPFLPTVAVVCACATAKWHAPEAQKARQKKAKAKKGSTKPSVADAETETTGDAEHQEHDEPEQPDEDAAAPLDLDLASVAATVRRVATRHPRHLGVHLADLLGEPEFNGWLQSDLKDALTDRWELPVVSFKLTFPDKARTREGVRLEHLPPAPAGRPGEGPARGLSLVPPETLASAPAGGPAKAPAKAPAGGPAGAVASPSPTNPPAPSQGPG